MYGVRNTSPLLVVPKRVKIKVVFFSCLSPEVSSRDIGNSLTMQLKLSAIVCTRLKAKLKAQGSFHVSVIGDSPSNPFTPRCSTGP